MNRTLFVQNTARDLWYEMIGHDKEPILTNPTIEVELELNDLVSLFDIKSVDGFNSNLSITMKNGDTFSKNYFDY